MVAGHSQKRKEAMGLLDTILEIPITSLGPHRTCCRRPGFSKTPRAPYCLNIGFCTAESRALSNPSKPAFSYAFLR